MVCYPENSAEATLANFALEFQSFVATKDVRIREGWYGHCQPRVCNALLRKEKSGSTDIRDFGPVLGIAAR